MVAGLPVTGPPIVAAARFRIPRRDGLVVPT